MIETGKKVLTSGQYRPVGEKNEYTFVKDKKVPPTKSGKTKFILVDETKHKKNNR